MNDDLPYSASTHPAEGASGQPAAPSALRPHPPTWPKPRNRHHLQPRAEPEQAQAQGQSLLRGKRVRFSDPGPLIQEDEHNRPSSSTGLTPMVRRTSLGQREVDVPASPSQKRKRHSAPVRRLADENDDCELAGSNSNNEIRILSLRQILDDRVKRRIRRNGLSEEMNTISESQRRRAQEQKAKLQRLKDELTEKNAEIGRLNSRSPTSNGSVNGNSVTTEDTARVALLEQQIQNLRDMLRDRVSTDAGDQGDNWALGARDPYSTTYMEIDTMMEMDAEMDDSGFGETTIAELVCSTPSRKKPSTGAKAPKSASASFPTPPSTSPPLPSTPRSTWPAAAEATTPTRRTPRSYNTGVQASLPDPEKEALEAELGSLRRELGKLTGTLESHAALQSRIASKLARADTSSPDHPENNDDNNSNNNNNIDADLEAHLDSVLDALSERTSTLATLDSSLRRLGFPGPDAPAIVASLASSFRTARLELEYITPGEITLPLSSRGAEVLDLVLARLRDLARRAREHDAAADEHRAAELSLRQQLSARVDAGDAAAARLRAAAEGYRADVRALEELARRAEREGAAAAEALRAELAEALAAAREARAEVAELNRAHGAQLALKDARAGEMRRELEEADRALREAHATICRLRAEGARAGGEAREVVGRMRDELERVMAVGNAFLGVTATATATGEPGDADADADADVGAGADTSGAGVKRMTRRSLGSGGAYLAGSLAKRRGSGEEERAQEKGKERKKRRRYDSGLGFEDEEEDESAVELSG